MVFHTRGHNMVLGRDKEDKSIPFKCTNCGKMHGDVNGTRLCPDCHKKKYG